jgi:hypothetical protein
VASNDRRLDALERRVAERRARGTPLREYRDCGVPRYGWERDLVDHEPEPCTHEEFWNESYVNYIRRKRRQFEEMGYSAHEGSLRPIPPSTEPWSDYCRRRLEDAD